MIEPTTFHRKPSQRGYETYDDALWICERCGPIEPHYSKLTGHWLRISECACQEQARRLHAEAERHLAWMRKDQQSCYNWLGSWISDDLPLVESTLTSFKRPLKWQEEAWNAARLFALQPYGTLVLHGPFGTGKTHLLAAICNELRTRHMSSRFCVAAKLHQAVAECHKSGEDAYRLTYQAITAPLLVIDDVGASKLSESRLETYETIIDERTKHKRPIAISTNYIDQLEQFVGGRAKSRLSMNQIAVEMDGDDYRMEM
jgi:DNA replication protein DnaC